MSLKKLVPGGKNTFSNYVYHMGLWIVTVRMMVAFLKQFHFIMKLISYSFRFVKSYPLLEDMTTTKVILSVERLNVSGSLKSHPQRLFEMLSHLESQA